MEALKMERVSKAYKLYSSRPRELKEILSLRRREFVTINALKDISFECSDGAMLGIIGPNGAGKSTLLKLASGVLLPDQGKVTVSGRVAALLELGAGFHPEFTGVENVYLYATIMGMPRSEIERRLDAIVAFAELERFMHLPLRVYSSGMQARLGFSVASHVDAQVLLVDEVLAVGDAVFQAKCMERIAQFRGQGGTIIWVTHDADSVRRMCDTALWLEAGQVAQLGDPREVVSTYLEASGQRYDENVQVSPVGSVGIDRHDLSATNVKIVGAEWAPNPVEIGESATLTINLWSEGNSPKLIVGFAIYSPDGRFVYGSNSNRNADRQWIEISYSGRVVVSFPDVSLVPGAYSIDIGVQDTDGRQLAYATRACTATVAGRMDEVGVAWLRHGWDWQ